MNARIRGFTLLELMVALTITGMLLMLGMPSFTTFLRNSEIRSTAESISNGLRAARTEATRLNRPVSFTLAAGTDPSWTINIFNPASGSLTQPPIQQYSRFEVGKSAQVTRLPATAIAVTFNGLGRIISPSPIATPNLQQVDVSSIVNGEARTLRVYADDVHGIRMCDPDPALKAVVPPDARAC
ncbi:MAG TPA: GspH/FimT family pseudopilin [Casimicrobiaceae bacterium]|nr:GspH/FimT family pseudopilin [Casimicrobiaceae bacterium]